MKNEIRYAYHEASGMVIHISQAGRGLNCGCKCQDCGSELEAVKGGQRTHYFRHSNGKNCNGETAVHFFAKQVIAAADNIYLPGGRIFYDNVRVEQTLHTKRPDITVSANGIDLHFEIKVTNAVKEDKRQFYYDGKHRCIEIDLSDRKLWLLTPEELKDLILTETWNKSIVYWGEELGEPSHVNNADNDLFNFFGRLILLLAGIFLLYRLAVTRKK